ncbi:hypothetical protein [Mesorhizobium australicum]|uniref:Uncharacterized protein n=1 Tax=Mesorhizobium australicum TaxID=536018 RepID=A0ACC6T1E7_9HYPH
MIIQPACRKPGARVAGVFDQILLDRGDRLIVLSRVDGNRDELGKRSIVGRTGDAG